MTEMLLELAAEKESKVYVYKEKQPLSAPTPDARRYPKTDFLISQEPIFPKVPLMASTNLQPKYNTNVSSEHHQWHHWLQPVGNHFIFGEGHFPSQGGFLFANALHPSVPLYLKALAAEPASGVLGWCTACLRSCSLFAPSTLSPPPLLPRSFCSSVSKEGEYLQEIHIFPELFSLVVQWEDFPFFHPCLYAECSRRQLEHWFILAALKHRLHQVFLQTGSFLHQC